MNARYRFAAFMLSLGVALTALASVSPAAPPKALLIAPGEPYGLPKFGFSSQTIHGFGERVVFVRYGGRAYHLGLEPGDVILSLNGYKLTYPGSWNDALSQTLYNNNYVTLKIRDVRTGNVYFRSTFVNYGGGPVQHYKKNVTSGSFPHHSGPFPPGNVHPFSSTIKSIKELKKLND